MHLMLHDSSGNESDARTTNVTTPPLPALKAQAEVESAGGILDHVAISDLLTPPDNDHIYGQIRPDGLL